MTREEATNILKAKLECFNRQTDFDCDNCDECSECSLCYKQGTMRDQKEALAMAIMELEDCKK